MGVTYVLFRDVIYGLSDLSISLSTSLDFTNLSRNNLKTQNANVDLDIYPSTGTVFMNKRPYDVVAESAKQVFHVYMFEQIAMGRVESINRYE